MASRDVLAGTGRLAANRPPRDFPLKDIEAPAFDFVEAGALWLTSPRLRAVAGLAHGFTLRAAGDAQSERGARKLTEKLGARRLRLLTQIHGVVVSRAEVARDRAEADAWAGRPREGDLLGILTADCLPVLLCHPRSRTVGLAHAGWRGAAKGIALETLKAMNVPVEEVLGALGPSIGPCCYQVGEDVAGSFGSDSPHVFPWGDTKGKYGVDLAGFVRTQLEDAGVRRPNLQTTSLCTSCRTDLFFSYRREGETRRMVAFLGWMGPQSRSARSGR